MMNKLVRVLACTSTLAAALALALPGSAAAAETGLSLFGTPLKGASRATLREALSKAGLQPKRVEDGYFCDLYKVDGQLKDASELSVCYTEDDDKFAAAEYTFPAFVDTGMVKRVVDMVSLKYGRPSRVSGNYGLGDVTAIWPQPQGMELRVARGWPDTTTYLDLIDVANKRRMQQQMAAVKAAQQRQQVQRDSKAF